MTYNFKQTYEKSKVWSQWFVLLMNHKKIRLHLIMFFINSQRVKKSFFSLRLTSHLKQCWYFWKQIWKYDWFFFVRVSSFTYFYESFGIFVQSHILYFYFSHSKIFFTNWLWYVFDDLITLSQRGRNDFHGNNFLWNCLLYICTFYTCRFLVTWTTKILFRKMKNWF